MNKAVLLALIEKWERIGNEKVESNGGDQDTAVDYGENCKRDGMLVCARELRDLITLLSE